MKTPIEKSISAAVKARAQARGITQARIALELKVSLVTVKRWYSGQGLSLTNLKLICDYLELPLHELLASIERPALLSFSYSLAQEQALAEDPKLLAFFDLLIGGSPLKVIQKKYELSSRRVNSFLLKLDKLGLILLGADNKFKLKNKGEPTWSVNGPLAKKFRKPMIEALLGTHDKNVTTFLIHDYLMSDVQVIERKFKELKETLLAANERAQLQSSESTSYGTYFTFKRFEWNIRDELKNPD